MRQIVGALAAAMFFAQSAATQTAARLSGTVRDSVGRPMIHADVTLIPSNRHARTDSLGAFAFDRVESGSYVLRARRVGYLPVEWSVEVSKFGRTDVQFVLATRLALLDTVRVRDDSPCEPQKYEGFVCRRARGKGIFVDDTDIDTMAVNYSSELLRDISGFTSVVSATRKGPTRVASSRSCTIVLMNGVPASWSSIPEAPYMITGIEIYKSPKDIPKEYLRYTWGKEHCGLVAYWTYDFTMKQLRGLSIPRRYRPAPGDLPME